MSAALAFGMAAGSAGMDTGGSLIQSAVNYEANRKLSEQEFQRNVDMWQMQNYYNLPKNQMARLKDAGLNPHLVYGTGTVTGNTIGNAPQYKRPEFQANIPQARILSQSQDYEIKNAELSNMAEVNAKLKAETDYINAKTVTESIMPTLRGFQAMTEEQRGGKMGVEYRVAKELEQTSIDAGQEGLRYLREQIKNIMFDSKIKEYTPTKMRAEVANLKKDNWLKSVTGAEKKLGMQKTASEIPLINEQVRELKNRIQNADISDSSKSNRQMIMSGIQDLLLLLNMLKK